MRSFVGIMFEGGMEDGINEEIAALLPPELHSWARVSLVTR